MVDEDAVAKRTTIAEVFLDLNLDRGVRIIDVACGIGVVAEELAPHGYNNIDGLDSSKGYIEVAKSKNLYKVSSILFDNSVACIIKLLRSS
jgi:2-polyprenyl-3-methyl-5-hydroxy-6-metoxy-1,4-benzoquinol methylase